MVIGWRTLIAFRLFGIASNNRLVSFIGLLSIGGLALAVAVLVIVLSVVNGFEKELRERVLGVLPHGTIYTRADEVDWHKEQQLILAHPDVIGAARMVEGSGLVIGNSGIHDRELVGVSFTGVLPSEEATVSILPNYMVVGSLDALEMTSYGTVIGAELAENLGLGYGDMLTLILPSVSFSLGGPVLTTKRLTIVGIFRVGADIDNNQLYLHLPDAQKLKRQTSIDGLVIRTNDLLEAPRILHELAFLSASSELYGISWMRRSGNLFEAIRTQKKTLALLLLILVAVASFNVVSNLVMTVDDNKSEMAILRTLGASPADMRVIFIIHGLMVGVVGILLGLAIGLLVTSSMSSIFVSLSELFGLNLMGEYFIRYLPTEILLNDLVSITMVSLVICLVATIYPASKAANTNPIEALQHEV